MNDRYLLTEALLRIERAAREYAESEGPDSITKYGLLVSELRDIDALRRRIEADAREVTA